MADSLPRISFVIPAHNEEYSLPACLDSVYAAGRAGTEPFEVIVVDDASTDATAAIATERGATVVPVSLRQIAAVRNAGTRVARGDVLVFVDADTVLPAATLAAALAALRDGAVGGGAMVKADHVGPVARFLFWSFCVFYMRLLHWAAGCFIFARREAFEAAGGFDERYFASEEIHLSKAMKCQGQFVILRQHVVTSGRKLRMHSVWHLVREAIRLLWGGDPVLQRREGLDLWYDGKREGPNGVRGEKSEERRA